MKIQTILCFIFLFYFQSQSEDFIKLKGGNSGTITTIDTTGNLVTYIRNGSKVTLKKNLIDYIIIGRDTISYNGFEPDPQAVHKESVKINKQYNTPTKNVQSSIVNLDQAQVASIEIKKSLNATFRSRFKLLGCFQIGGAVISEILVIRDATKKETVSVSSSGKISSLSFQHKWALGHTILSILNGLFLTSGITLLTIKF